MSDEIAEKYKSEIHEAKIALYSSQISFLAIELKSVTGTPERVIKHRFLIGQLLNAMNELFIKLGQESEVKDA